MNYKIVQHDEKEKWDSIVKSFARYDVYYLNGYVEAFRLIGDGEPFLFYYENGSVRAMNVFMKRDLAFLPILKNEMASGQYFDIVTPYGYGGFIVEGNDLECLKNTYEQFCREEHIICEFVRFHPLLRNWRDMGHLYEMVHLGDTVYIDTSTTETIWNNMTSKNRNVIRKAVKSGLKVYWERSSRMIATFMEIYNATMKKNNAEEYYFFKEDFYKSILEDLKYNSMWFYSEIDGNIAAIAIFLFCNGSMHYHLSASRSEYQNLAPSNLLLYEAANWAVKNGYRQLHLGGGLGSGHDNLYKFKKAFNRQEDHQFWIGKKIFDKDMYMNLVQVRRKNDSKFDENSTYFPLYRS